jgi:O-antigen biosynthesis protein
MKNDHIYNTNININENNSSHSKILKKIIPKKTILEIGPADGYMTQYLNQKLKCIVDCFEIDEKYKQNLENYSRKVFIGDIENSDLNILLKDEKYDYIIFADVLEHLYNPWELLNNIKKFLNKNGKVIASIPNIGNGSVILSLLSGYFPYSGKGLLDKTHIRFFTRYSLVDLFENSGFHIIEIDTTILPFDKTEISGYSYPLHTVEAIKNLMKSNQDFQTYQFIVEAEISQKSNHSQQGIIDSKQDINELMKLKIELENIKGSKFYKIYKFIRRFITRL